MEALRGGRRRGSGPADRSEPQQGRGGDLGEPRVRVGQQRAQPVDRARVAEVAERGRRSRDGARSGLSARRRCRSRSTLTSGRPIAPPSGHGRGRPDDGVLVRGEGEPEQVGRAGEAPLTAEVAATVRVVGLPARARRAAPRRCPSPSAPVRRRRTAGTGAFRVPPQRGAPLPRSARRGARGPGSRRRAPPGAGSRSASTTSGGAAPTWQSARTWAARARRIVLRCERSCGARSSAPCGEQDRRQLLGRRTAHLGQEVDDGVVQRLAGRSVHGDQRVAMGAVLVLARGNGQQVGSVRRRRRASIRRSRRVRVTLVATMSSTRARQASRTRASVSPRAGRGRSPDAGQDPVDAVQTAHEG